MSPSWPAISSIALALGCVAPLDTDAPSSDPVRVSAQPTSVEQAVADEPDICGLLPTCGPCSLACDPEKLAEEYVPEGACALFVCPLTDGRTIQFEACHYVTGTETSPQPSRCLRTDPSCRPGSS